MSHKGTREEVHSLLIVRTAEVEMSWRSTQPFAARLRACFMPSTLGAAASNALTGRYAISGGLGGLGGVGGDGRAGGCGGGGGVGGGGSGAWPGG